MKKYIFIPAFSLLTGLLSAQVSMGGNQTVNGASTILDFAGQTATGDSADSATLNEKGIILPAVAVAPAFSAVTPATDHANNGTFIYDRSTKMVRMFENGTWVNLSDGTGNDAGLAVNNSAETGSGAIIGSNSTAAEGVLVLESDSKAMVLPHIANPHLTVKSPYPGMMCYDTVSNSLAVYDGLRWNYWK